MNKGWKRGYRILAISAAALLVAGGTVAVAQAGHGGKDKAKKGQIATQLVRGGVHADVSLIRADGSTDAFAVDRGKITASSATSLTIARPDGKSVTFSVSSATISRRMITVGRPALVFSRNGAAFRIVAAGPLTAEAGAPALANGGKSPVVHLSVQITRADGSTVSFVLDRGTVTAASATSLTIERADGQSVTFSIGAAIVRGHLAVGGKALVLSRNGAVTRVLARA